MKDSDIQSLVEKLKGNNEESVKAALRELYDAAVKGEDISAAVPALENALEYKINAFFYHCVINSIAAETLAMHYVNKNESEKAKELLIRYLFEHTDVTYPIVKVLAGHYLKESDWENVFFIFEKDDLAVMKEITKFVKDGMDISPLIPSIFPHLIRNFQHNHLEITDLIVAIGGPVVPYLIEEFEKQVDEPIYNTDIKAKKYLLKSINSLLTGIGKPAIPCLIDTLLKSEENYGVEPLAVEVLVKIGHDPLTVSKMIDVLKNENESGKYVATHILSKIGAKSAVPYLFKGLDDKNTLVRIETVDALGNLGDTTAVPYLLTELKKKDVKTLLTSIEALEKLLPEVINEGKNITALEVIKECTAALMEDCRIFLRKFKGSRRTTLKQRRERLVKFDFYAQQIYDKMNSEKKKFPINHQQVRKIKIKKVIVNG